MLEKIAVSLISVYQGHVRPALPCSCRFAPSCSEYAREAISKYGFSQGAVKALKRIFSCHPFSKKSGYDPLV